MNKKVFAVTALAGLAGLSGVALETRPAAPAPVPQQAAPNIETVVVQRTVHIRRRIKRRMPPAGGGSAQRSAAVAAAVYRPSTVPIAVRPAPVRAPVRVAPRVKTSPSSTGGKGHKSEGGDHGGGRDD